MVFDSNGRNNKKDEDMSNTKQLTLLLDMDSVCADLLTVWLYEYNKTYDDNLTADKIVTWDWAHLTKCAAADLYKLTEKPGFFRNLPVMPGAIEVTTRLQQKGHIMFFVTAVPYTTPTALYDKSQWVIEHMPHIGPKNVIAAHKKDMIRGDLLLDDSPRNLSEFGKIKVAYDYPYNREAKADYRIRDWFEFEKLVDELAAKDLT